MRTRRQAAWLLVVLIFHCCPEIGTSALLGATDACRGRGFEREAKGLKGRTGLHRTAVVDWRHA